MPASLSSSSLTLDPLIADARSRARERHAQVARLAGAALIVGGALAGAAFVQHLRFTENASQGLVLIWRVVHPWWSYPAIVALFVLGAAGAGSLLTTARRAATSGYAAASVLFIVAGFAALADTRLYFVGIVGLTNFGHTNLAVALLLLGLVSAVLAVTCGPRRRQSHREPTIDSAG